MKRGIGLYRYLLMEAGKAVGTYFAIVLLIVVSSAIFENIHFQYTVDQSVFSTAEFTTPVFLLILGLNSFKASFLFAMGNGYTRREYHRVAALALLTVGTVVSLADSGLHLLSGTMGPGIFTRWPQAFPHDSAVALETWRWAFNLVVAAVGLCVTTAFYRLGPTGKVWLSLIPSVLAVLFFVSVLAPAGWVKGIYAGVIVPVLVLSGIAPTPNALLGALTMAAVALALLALARLLIRGAPVKEQER